MTTNNKKLTSEEIDAFNSERQKLNDALPNFCTPLPLLKKDEVPAPIKPLSDEEIDAINVQRTRLNDALPNFCTHLPMLQKDDDLPNVCLNSKDKVDSEINKIRKKSSTPSSPSNLYLSYFK